MEIAVDFDGTCVKHNFPKLGEEIGAAPVLRELVANGHFLILYTVRSDNKGIKVDTSSDPTLHPFGGNYLTQAVEWFKKHDIPLYGIQSNPSQRQWTTSPKCYAQLYIDDAALGCPLIQPKGERPYVDWDTVRKMLVDQKIIK